MAAASSSSRMSNRGSQDDLLMAMADADDAHSIAASSTPMTSISSASSMARYAVGSSAASIAGVPSSQRSVVLNRTAMAAAAVSRDSSKDSSDELLSGKKQ